MWCRDPDVYKMGGRRRLFLRGPRYTIQQARPNVTSFRTESFDDYAEIDASLAQLQSSESDRLIGGQSNLKLRCDPIPHLVALMASTAECTLVMRRSHLSGVRCHYCYLVEDQDGDKTVLNK